MCGCSTCCFLEPPDPPLGALNDAEMSDQTTGPVFRHHSIDLQLNTEPATDAPSPQCGPQRGSQLVLDTLVGHVLTAVSECGSDPSLLLYFTWSNLKSARYLLSILHTVALSALLTRRAVFVLSAHFFSMVRDSYRRNPAGSACPTDTSDDNRVR